MRNAINDIGVHASACAFWLLFFSVFCFFCFLTVGCVVTGLDPDWCCVLVGIK